MSVAAIAAGVGAAATAYGAYASSQGGEAPAPVQSNPGKDLLKYLSGLNKGLPQLAQMEGEYRPQFGQLNINDQTQYLNALLGLGGSTNAATGQQLQDARQSEFANMRANTGSVLGVLGGVDPGGQQLAGQTQQIAMQRLQAAQSLNPQEKRMADQTAREAFSSRGRLNDNAGVAAEVLGREDVLTNKRNDAFGLAGQAFGMGQQFASPALSMLLGVPGSVSLGQDYLGRSAGAIGQNSPQFINPDAGMNMGMQNTANLNAYMQANAAAKQNSAAQWGQVGSSLVGLAGTIYQNR